MQPRKSLCSPIYIIDDSEIDCFILRRIIMETGFPGTINYFEFAQQAINHLETEVLHKQTQEWPCLIFLDINMPDMNGFEFLERFKKFPIQQLKETKVYIVSSSYEEEDVKQANNFFMVKDYLQKPVSSNQIEKILTQIYNSAVFKI